MTNEPLQVRQPLMPFSGRKGPTSMLSVGHAEVDVAPHDSQPCPNTPEQSVCMVVCLPPPPPLPNFWGP